MKKITAENPRGIPSGMEVPLKEKIKRESRTNIEINKTKFPRGSIIEKIPEEYLNQWRNFPRTAELALGKIMQPKKVLGNL